MKDHEIRELVNRLRAIAVAYHAHGCLREIIADEVVDALRHGELRPPHPATEKAMQAHAAPDDGLPTREQFERSQIYKKGFLDGMNANPQEVELNDDDELVPAQQSPAAQPVDVPEMVACDSCDNLMPEGREMCKECEEWEARPAPNAQQQAQPVENIEADTLRHGLRLANERIAQLEAQQAQQVQPVDAVLTALKAVDRAFRQYDVSEGNVNPWIPGFAARKLQQLVKAAIQQTGEKNAT